MMGFSRRGPPSGADVNKRKARRLRTPCHSQCTPRRGACGKTGVVPHNPPSKGGGRMGCSVLRFHEIDQTQVAVVGGKGAHLGELSRIEGIRVPAGYCVTADAFRRI